MLTIQNERTSGHEVLSRVLLATSITAVHARAAAVHVQVGRNQRTGLLTPSHCKNTLNKTNALHKQNSPDRKALITVPPCINVDVQLRLKLDTGLYPIRTSLLVISGT
jgi:hypothetical protein